MTFSPLTDNGPVASTIGDSAREETEVAVGKGVLSFSNIEDEDEPLPPSWLVIAVTPLAFTASTASPSFANDRRLEGNAMTGSATSGALGGTGGTALIGDTRGEVIGRL